MVVVGRADAACQSILALLRMGLLGGVFPWAVRCADPVARNDGFGCAEPIPHCVLATRGGVAWVMNWVASSVAGSSGVGILIQEGTRIRVPPTGTKGISVLRWAAGSLVTGRSAM